MKYPIALLTLILLSPTSAHAQLLTADQQQGFEYIAICRTLAFKLGRMDEKEQWQDTLYTYLHAVIDDIPSRTTAVNASFSAGMTMIKGSNIAKDIPNPRTHYAEYCLETVQKRM